MPYFAARMASRAARRHVTTMSGVCCPLVASLSSACRPHIGSVLASRPLSPANT